MIQKLTDYAKEKIMDGTFSDGVLPADLRVTVVSVLDKVVVLNIALIENGSGKALIELEPDTRLPIGSNLVIQKGRHEPMVYWPINIDGVPIKNTEAGLLIPDTLRGLRDNAADDAHMGVTDETALI